MNLDADRNIARLNELIAVCTDVAMSFHECSERGISGELKVKIENFSSSLENVMEALRTEIIYLDGAPQMQTTLVGEAKRAYSLIKAGISSDEDKTVAAHLESLGERTVNKFSEVLCDQCLSPKVRGIVQLQHGQVSDIQNCIRTISDELSGKR